MSKDSERPNGQNNSREVSDEVQIDETDSNDHEPPKRTKGRTAAYNGRVFTEQEIKELFASDLGKQLMQNVKQRITRKLWDKSRVEDVFHEVLAGTIQNLKKGHIKESLFTPYVMRITSNQLKREYERAAKIRENETSLDVYTDDVDPNADKRNGSAKQDLSEADVALTLKKAYQSLTEEEQRVFELRENRGYSYETIASELNISPGNARLMRHRATATITQYLKGNLYAKIFGRKE
jgi:RNA polymerase sigma factor (sigma-70 family)